MVHQAEGQTEPSSELKSHESSVGTAAKTRTLGGQLLLFGAVGVVGFLVNAGMVEWLAHSIGPIWAQVLVFPVAVSTTWWLNRRYTFGASTHLWHREWMRYIAANLTGWIVINGIYFFLILKYFIFYQNPVLALIVGAIAGFVLNFTFSRLFVFGGDNEK